MFGWAAVKRDARTRGYTRYPWLLWLLRSFVVLVATRASWPAIHRAPIWHLESGIRSHSPKSHFTYRLYSVLSVLWRFHHSPRTPPPILSLSIATQPPTAIYPFAPYDSHVRYHLRAPSFRGPHPPPSSPCGTPCDTKSRGLCNDVLSASILTCPIAKIPRCPDAAAMRTRTFLL